jgi:hypothetical protein
MMGSNSINQFDCWVYSEKYLIDIIKILKYASSKSWMRPIHYWYDLKNPLISLRNGKMNPIPNQDLANYLHPLKSPIFWLLDFEETFS